MKFVLSIPNWSDGCSLRMEDIDAESEHAAWNKILNWLFEQSGMTKPYKQEDVAAWGGSLRRDYDAEMKLPEGKACRDCVHAARCFSLGYSWPARTSCDFHPNKFTAAVAAASSAEGEVPEVQPEKAD